MSTPSRIFVALPLSDGQREALAALQARLKGKLTQFRWTRPEQAHLTLAFLGEVPPERAERVPEAVCAAASRHAPFPLVLGGAGAFPKPRRARVLWVGCREGREALVELQRDLAEELRSSGVDLDAKPFRPHVTLGRSRGRPRALALPPELERWSSPRAFPSAVQIVGSVLGPSGAAHTELASCALGG